MSQRSDRTYRRAVVCLFCGTHTPLPEARSPDDVRLSIIRCRQCGKEAPYPAAKIIESQDIPSDGIVKIRAVDIR